MDVSVIVVTYNSASCIRKCLTSVFAQTGVTFECVVVDNVSGDNSRTLAAEFPVRLIANAENVGYGRGNNQGFKASSGRYIYLLNPDAELEGNDALAKLCRAMDANPRWGICSTLIRSPEGDTESPPAYYYPGQRHTRSNFSELPGKIAWVLGASLMTRREVFTALEGFDSGFFHASEDTDLCLRARKQGWEIGYVDDVSVRHIGQVSERDVDPYELCKHKIAGMLRFRQKHYSPQDTLRLTRRDVYRARFRMFCHGLKSWFKPPRSIAWQKYRRYLAIWEVSRNFLRTNKLAAGREPHIQASLK
jgi:GT2 family glycosyltransferase